MCGARVHSGEFVKSVRNVSQSKDGAVIRVSRTRSTTPVSNPSLYSCAPPMRNARCVQCGNEAIAASNDACDEVSTSAELFDRQLKLVDAHATYTSIPLAETTTFVRDFRGRNFVGMLSQLFRPMMTAFFEPSGRLSASPVVAIDDQLTLSL